MTNDHPSSGVAKWLAGGITTATGALGVFGAAAGTLQRVARNDAEWAFIFFAVIALALAIGVLAPILSNRLNEAIFLPLGVIALFIGIGGLGWLAARSASTKERPQVTASLVQDAGKLSVKGSVEASGLQSNEHMLIRVEGRVRASSRTLAEFHAGSPRGRGDRAVAAEDGDFVQPLYVARLGPDAEGDVKASIDTPVSPGLYERIVVTGEVVGPDAQADTDEGLVRRCTRTTRFWGCARILVPVAAPGQTPPRRR